MESETESTTPFAMHRGRSLLVDLVVMGCTGASIAFYAHMTLSNKEAGVNSLASLGFFTAIAVLVGTIALQLMQQLLQRRHRKAAIGRRIKPIASHNHGAAQEVRRGKSSTGAVSRSENVRFSGRS
jgi:hypothetical protein